MTELPPPEPEYLSYATPSRQSSNGLAIASMVCGIVSIPLMPCAWFVAIPAAIVAVVLGFVARRRALRGEAEGKGMALAGIICGSSALALVVLAAVAFVAMFSRGKNSVWMSTTTRSATTAPAATVPSMAVPVGTPNLPPPTTAPR